MLNRTPNIVFAAITMSAIASASAATLSVTNIRRDRIAFATDAGLTTTGTLSGQVNTFSSLGSTLTLFGDDLDLFGTGNGTYDVRFTVTLSGSMLNTATAGRITLNNAVTLSYATPTLTIFESDGVTLASDVSIDRFDGYSLFTTTSFTDDLASYDDSGSAIDSTAVISGDNILSSPTQDLNFTSTSGSWILNKVEANFSITQSSSVPEPSSVALFGLSGLALFFRRRKS